MVLKKIDKKKDSDAVIGVTKSGNFYIRQMFVLYTCTDYKVHNACNCSLSKPVVGFINCTNNITITSQSLKYRLDNHLCGLISSFHKQHLSFITKTEKHEILIETKHLGGIEFVKFIS